MEKNHRNNKEQPSRRHFLKILWGGLGFAALVELILVVVSFFRPAAKKEATKSATSIIDAGTTDYYTPGTVTAFVAGQFYLICDESGGFLAFSSKCTHLGCALPWDNTERKFICPCHASQFDILGNVLSSPAPRALDLFAVTIVNNRIQVDIGNRIKRNRFTKNQLVYPEAVTIINESGRE